MRKKTITILLTIVLVLALVGVAVAEALQESNTTNLQIVTDASGALDGKSTLKVTVSNKANIDLNALTFHVDFDTNELEVTNIAFTVNGNTVTAEDDLTPNNGEVKGGGHSDVSEANTSGTAGFYYMDVTEQGDALSAQENGVQAVITFKVKSGLTADSTGDIKLYEDSASNSTWFNLRKEDNKSAGTASVTFSGGDVPYTLGDLNGDGKVTEADAVYLLGYTIFPDIYPLNQPVDFNKSGGVSEADAIYLLGYTIFAELYPLS